eukprot:CAMPEP_0178411028 /NCGR_PEP_ID=MMETSP0689_2-20121128/21285_1 /TAXON_ID=160604 /ORGANISM="Amphidinium massartii, Strain CS-259" /LENGTH=238 /DNA_ID=CAMNT_0020032225 /DNA_START=351 /DNA_END=1067 /DNA_ORIENTATION=+
MKQKEMFGKGTFMTYDQHQRNLFYKERNLWLTILGLSLWLIAWRLTVMKRNGMLLASSELKQQRPPSFFRRFMWIVIALFCMGMADLPLCRLNYHYQLHAHVTPQKEELLGTVQGCERAKLQDATGECKDFCESTRQLSQERLNIIMWARDWHVLGKYAAEVFDNVRGMKQGEDRINKLFAERSCLEVLKKVDKSNAYVNGICFVVAGVMVLGVLMALGRVFDFGASELIADKKKKKN